MTSSPNSHIDTLRIPGGPELHVTWPDGHTGQHSLKPGRTTIGRSPECDLEVPNEFKAVSRQHLVLEDQGGQFVAIDAGSANGVWLNGDRIQNSASLQNGDELVIGDADRIGLIRFRFYASAWGVIQSMVAESGNSELEIPGQGESISGRLPYLIVHYPDGRSASVEINEDFLLVGRSVEAGLQIPAPYRFVSGRQFEIRTHAGEFTVTDLESINGTRLDNLQLVPGTPASLTDGAVIRIGNADFGESIGFLFQNPFENLPMGESWQLSGSQTKVWQQETMVIGRSSDCDLVLPHPRVSRRHAEIHQLGERFILIDLNSSNGTYLNGERIKQDELFDGDLINIGGHLLLFRSGQVSAYVSKGMRLDIIGLTKDIRTRGRQRRILQPIDMTVLPGEFIAIVGASGAGKTTLIRALTGIDQGEGQVRVNGRDFYSEYERFRSELGYVPQFDILHTTLTVDQALGYAARLRLPGDLTVEERRRRIDEVLETVSMADPAVRGTRIANLSGGQRKRVSIAAELLADPKLIYLDEATSGLDPGLEKKLMHTLRQMADEGRTVVLITHATTNIVQADHVAFLSQGRLIFFGPSRDALKFFEVDEFADIYEEIEGSGERWEKTFKAEKPDYHQRYIEERKQSLKALPSQQVRIRRNLIGQFIIQLTVLTQRAFKVITSDWITLALLMLLFPLTATLQLVISTPDVLTGNTVILADPAGAALDMTEPYAPFPDMNTFVFVMGLEAVLVGLFVPSNELIKERSVFLRERMVNLGVLSYLFSKGIIFTFFSFIQVVLYLLVLSLGVDYPEQGLYLPGTLELFVTLFLTMLAGNGLGLLISSVSRNTEMAIYLLTLMLFFQFFFAGTVFDLRDRPAELLSYMTGTRWSLTALGITTNIDGITASTILCNNFDDPFTPEVESIQRCFHYPEAADDLLLPYDDANLMLSWLVLIGMMGAGYAMTGLVLWRQD